MNRMRNDVEMFGGRGSFQR